MSSHYFQTDGHAYRAAGPSRHPTGTGPESGSDRRNDAWVPPFPLLGDDLRASSIWTGMA